VLISDPNGEERWRLEGYLPKEEFRANLEMGRARVAFMAKNWSESERIYTEVIERYPNSKFSPEAIYYRGVSRYSISHQGTELADTASALAEKFPDSEWRLRSLPWAE
jgi:outer membrane protein assembly factor BamD (BamD/ComL family)